MKVTLDDISAEGLSLDLEEKVDLDGLNLTSPVSAHLDISRFGTEVAIRGSLKAEIEYDCSRCLKPFTGELDISLEVEYLPADQKGAERSELHDDEMNTAFYSGDEIDLTDVLREQILLNVQMKPLCDEDCRGICPTCGTDLNVEQCNCEKKEIDPRLEVLKTLLEKGKE